MKTNKEKLLDNIKEGLLNYYLDQDYSKNEMEAKETEYSKVAKRIRFKASAQIKK